MIRMLFPDTLEPFRHSSKRYLDEGRVKEVLFSGPTYQIEFQDIATHESVWVFVQFHEEKIKDLFCSCQSSSETGACEHMAASCHYLAHQGSSLLHERFARSLYNTLFFELFSRAGLRGPQVQKKQKSYRIVAGDTLLFTMQGKENDALNTLICDRKEETEENSIKFSNLTEEELDEWRDGKAPLALRFELSFLSDFAKQLFLSDAPLISFHEKKGALPQTLVIEAKLGHIEVSLDKALLEKIIPTLTMTKCSLPYIDMRTEDIRRLEYDPIAHTLLVDREENPVAGEVVGEYVYVYQAGFFKRHEKNTISLTGPSVAHFLDEKEPFLHTLLSTPVALSCHPVSYHIEVTAKKELHIEAFLFERGDVLAKGSRVFGHWAYIEKKGLLKIEPLKFLEPMTLISCEAVGHFIMHNRCWLNQFPQFQVHTSCQEEKIVYKVSSDGTLTFHQEMKKAQKLTATHDFGDWIYCKNRGFFLKTEQSDKSHAFLFDQPIPQGRVSDFILRHIDIISRIPHFFTQEAPVTKMGVEVKLKKANVIEIVPKYEWVSDSVKKQAIFFDEFIFVPKKGFYRLPSSFCPLYYVREIKSSDRELWNAFFMEELPKLRAELDCHVDKRLEKIEMSSLTMQGVDLNKASTWDVNLVILVGSEKILIKDLLHAKKRGYRFFPTAAGVLDLDDDRLYFLSQLAQKKISKRGTFSFTSTELLRLQAYEPICIDDNPIIGSEHKAILSQLLQSTTTQKPSYPLLRATLRPYQQLGVEWLYTLYQNGLSGLLSDDMGVGKTHQAMALMASIHELKRKSGQKATFLVICPTSVVYHWQEKLMQFLPTLKVNTYVTLTRSLEDLAATDIILTTYGIFRSDVAKFKNCQFEAAIFDELQIAKNHVSQIHAALLRIKAAMRVGLTGTPIENELRELKAVFDLVLPGYMPDDNEFREFFVRPIEREMHDARRKLLSRLVKPFILRRKKQEVLPDLPEKIEEVSHAELLGEQKTLYRHVAALQASTLLQQLQDEAMPIPYMHIFALLTALKQICNHPASYLKDTENYARYESGKWELFLEILEEAKESGQKVVVFSQYLNMLDIIEAHVKKIGMGYAQIRGETRMRGEQVAKFHKDPNCMIFLGSLQAAGLGIDLTAAQVVIHYDRWWNPARENQATDRVHRIGQQRGVQVFKMVTKETIEEKIDAMIARKKELLEDIVTFDDQHIVKKMTRDEIIGLLQELTVPGS